MYISKLLELVVSRFVVLVDQTRRHIDKDSWPVNRTTKKLIDQDNQESLIMSTMNDYVNQESQETKIHFSPQENQEIIVIINKIFAHVRLF